MQATITKTISAAALVVLMSACGNSSKEAQGELGEKKAELAKLKEQATAINDKIATLEDAIAKLDTAAAAHADKGKLIDTAVIALQNFNHYIELQGRVDAENISYVTPRGVGGQVVAIYVRQGDQVKKGQLLLKLDDRVINQQMEQLKTQLAFAKDIYERRAGLWKQNIGSEVELLSAKNNVDNLEKQMQIVQEQKSMTNVYAEVSGFVNTMNARVGQVFQGVSGAVPDITIINNNNLKVVTDIPENYLGKVNRGSVVEINVPDINRNYTSSVNFVAAAINPASRGFSTEAKLPADGLLKPNQIALVRILDYASPNAIVVPVKLIQSDEKGKYVFVVTKTATQLVAAKKMVTVGQVQGDYVEIKAGLTVGDILISEGYQALYDGQKVSTTL